MGLERTAEGALRAFRGVLVEGSVLRGIGLLGAGTVGAHAIAALSAPVISRFYTPAEFGVVGVFFSVQALLVLVGNLQYGLAIPLPERGKTAAALLVLSMVLLVAVSVCTAIAGWLGADAVAAAVQTPEFATVAWMLALGVVLNGAYDLLVYWGLRRGAYRDIAGSKVSASALRSVTTIGLGGLNFGAAGLIVGELLGRLAGTWRMLRCLDRDDRQAVRAVTVRDVRVVGRRYVHFPMFSASAAILHSLQTTLPVLFFALLYGPHIAGLVTFILRVVWPPLALASQSVGDVYLGKAAELARRDVRQLDRLFADVTRTLFLVVVPVVAAVAVLGDPLFGVVFGRQWQQAGHYLQILSVGFAVRLVVGPVVYTLTVLERQAWLLANEAAGVLLIVGGLLVAQRLGAAAEETVMVYTAAVTLTYAALFWSARTALKQRLAAVSAERA